MNASVPGTEPFALLALLVVLSGWLRTRALDAPLWIDEGISIGIASHPLGDIPGLLLQDGSPPLYYLLLHVWTEVFGDGVAATHALSLACALACIPAAYWAAQPIGRPWAAAALAASSPFLTYYAQETRMYALVVLLGLVVCGAYVRTFADGERRWLSGFVVAGAALALTHYWGLFLLAGLLLAARGKDALLAGAGIAVLFAPWLPSFVSQVRHTGAPWSLQPGVWDIAEALGAALGGTLLAILVVLAAGVRRDPATGRLLGAALGGLVLAWLASQLDPAWAGRYMAAFLAPLLLVIARLPLVLVVVVALLWLDPRTDELRAKSNVAAVARELSAHLRPGDAVLVTHPEQTPLLRLALGDGYRWFDALGPVPDPLVFDWRDALGRLREARPEAVFAEAARGARRLAVVHPIVHRTGWSAPWTALVARRVPRWERAEQSMRIVARVPQTLGEPLPRGVRADILASY